MKRLLRILIKLVTLPVIIFMFVFFYIISICFVFYEWLFENENIFYSSKESHKDFLKDSKKYIMNFFK